MITQPTTERKQKKSFLHRIPYIVAISTIFNAVVWLAYGALLIRSKSNYVSGLEYVAFMLIPLLYIGVILSTLSVMLVIFYLAYAKPRGRALVASIVVGLASLGYSGWFIYSQYQTHNINSEANRTLTQDEAVNLIKTCQINTITIFVNGDVILFPKSDATSSLIKSGYNRKAPTNSFELLTKYAKDAQSICGKIDIHDFRN